MAPSVTKDSVLDEIHERMRKLEEGNRQQHDSLRLMSFCAVPFRLTPTTLDRSWYCTRNLGILSRVYGSALGEWTSGSLR